MDKAKREQSMIRNLKAVAGNRFGAAEAKFKLSRLREATGQSEQSLLVKLVLFAYEKMPEFAGCREKIDGDWAREKHLFTES